MRKAATLRATRPVALRQAVRQYTAPVPIVLPPLPYNDNALEPLISQETLQYHYGKHHAGYVTKLNGNLPTNTKPLVPLLKDLKASGDQKNFNLAAQVWNHTFYWESMAPHGRGGDEPEGSLAEAIERDFGSFALFKEQFTAAGANLFGSGWVWLVQDASSRKLKIVATSNAECPLTAGDIPLLTMDVWEHAYYMYAADPAAHRSDYRHERARYIDAFWKLVNWEFASRNML